MQKCEMVLVGVFLEIYTVLAKDRHSRALVAKPIRKSLGEVVRLVRV
jgi:hypothetical protein